MKLTSEQLEVLESLPEEPGWVIPSPSSYKIDILNHFARCGYAKRINVINDIYGYHRTPLGTKAVK